jgi:hypothetical protein
MNYAGEAERVGVLRTGLGLENSFANLVCMCVYVCMYDVCMYVCMYVRHAQKIAKLFFERRASERACEARSPQNSEAIF